MSMIFDTNYQNENAKLPEILDALNSIQTEQNSKVAQGASFSAQARY